MRKKSVRLKAKLSFELKSKLLRKLIKLVVGFSSASSQRTRLLVVFDKAKILCWEKLPLRCLLDVLTFKPGRVRFFRRGMV